jgi:pantothenate kinase type III
MLLAIEQGNTNTMFAIHDGAVVGGPMALGHREHPHRR